MVTSTGTLLGYTVAEGRKVLEFNAAGLELQQITSPAITGNLLYFGYTFEATGLRGGKLFALDVAARRLKWEIKGMEFTSAPAFKDGKMYVASSQDLLAWGQ